MKNEVMSKHYHFIGIGGIGMGALASLLLDRGERVSGSDLRDNAMTQSLQAKGATVFQGHASQQISGADYVVYSSAIKDGNPELEEAKVQGIPIMQRAQLLAELMQSYTGVTVAGAHGKTTTTSLISDMLTKAGLKPTTAVGGIINELSSNAALGQGDLFVAEVDESDGSFLNFSPHYSVITNIDNEHLDHYGNYANILKAYADFIQKTQEDGLIIACGEDEQLVTLLNNAARTFMTYGFSDDHHVCAQDISFNGFTTSFSCYVHKELLGTVQLAIPGEHNVLNALACVAIGIEVGVAFEKIQMALETFAGVQRRLQVKGRVHQIQVVDDYAHHPTEIENVLATAQRLKEKRLVTVFQPHRFTRLQQLFEDFVRVLANTDYLIVTDVYAASEEPIEGVNAQKLVERVRTLMDDSVVYVPTGDIVQHVSQMAQEGDLILTLGAGDINQISEKIVEALQ